MHHYSHFECPKMAGQKNNIQNQQKSQKPIPRISSHSFLAILFATLFLLLFSKCSATISNSNSSSHQSTGPDQQLHQNPQNDIQSSHSAGHNARFHSFGEQREEKNLFREYLSRGMFSCAEKYVSILVKLNKLISVGILNLN
jgi:hypothetical protein